MDFILHIIVGIMIGTIIGWLLSKAKNNITSQSEKEKASQKIIEIEKDLLCYKATTIVELQTLNDRLNEKQEEM